MIIQNNRYIYGNTVYPFPRVNGPVSFGYSKINLKKTLHLLDHCIPQVHVQDNRYISVPLLEKTIRSTGRIPATKNFRLSKKIAMHPYLETLREEQVQRAKNIILQNAKRDGTEVMITDLDSTILEETNTRLYQRNPLKDPISFFLIMTGLSRKYPVTRKIYVQQGVRWMRKYFSPPIPSTVNFLKEMQQNNIKVIGLTARSEITKQSTLANLESLGLHFDQVLFHPNPAGTDNRFKTKTLQRLSTQHKVLGVLGDQYKDLIPPDKQGFNLTNIADTVNILLPNPYYSFSGFLY